MSLIFFSAMISENFNKMYDYIYHGWKTWYLKNAWFLLGLPIHAFKTFNNDWWNAISLDVVS